MAQPVQKAHDADSPTIRCKANELDEYQERRYDEWRKRVDDMFEEINAEKLRQDQRQLQEEEEEEEEEKISAGSRLAPKPRQRLSQCFLARRYFTTVDHRLSQKTLRVEEDHATHIVAPPSDSLSTPGRRVPLRARRIGLAPLDDCSALIYRATAGGRQSVEASKAGEGLGFEQGPQHGLSPFTGILHGYLGIINASSDGLVPPRLVAPARMVEDASETFSPQEDGRGEDKFLKASRSSGYSLVGTMFSVFNDGRSLVHRTTCVHEVDIISRARASAVVYLPQLETVLSPWERRKLRRRRLLDRRQKFRRYCLRPLPSPSLLIIDGFGLCPWSTAARSVGDTHRRTEQMRLWKMHSVTSSRIVKCVPGSSSSARQLNVRQKRSGPSLARRGPPTASPAELFSLGPIAPAGCEPPVDTEVTRATSCCDRASPKVKRRLIEATLEDGRATMLYQEPVVQTCNTTPVEGCGTNRSRQARTSRGAYRAARGVDSVLEACKESSPRAADRTVDHEMSLDDCLGGVGVFGKMTNCTSETIKPPSRIKALESLFENGSTGCCTGQGGRRVLHVGKPNISLSISAARGNGGLATSSRHGQAYRAFVEPAVVGVNPGRGGGPCISGKIKPWRGLEQELQPADTIRLKRPSDGVKTVLPKLVRIKALPPLTAKGAGSLSTARTAALTRRSCGSSGEERGFERGVAPDSRSAGFDESMGQPRSQH
ncbi:hypothetical protein FOZ62_002601 [Perkinsus olseni]|uniref:Uncharacterized protein n=1 Tax=Perkinsus olseni TaxID=32597 RepID=A0A7J6TQD5_PEROL|nr:hypothetical protein FOZ62_002601 [Perkinsus olseni]